MLHWRAPHDIEHWWLVFMFGVFAAVMLKCWHRAWSSWYHARMGLEAIGVRLDSWTFGLGAVSCALLTAHEACEIASLDIPILLRLPVVLMTVHCAIIFHVSIEWERVNLDAHNQLRASTEQQDIQRILHTGSARCCYGNAAFASRLMWLTSAIFFSMVWVVSFSSERLYPAAYSAYQWIAVVAGVGQLWVVLYIAARPVNYNQVSSGWIHLFHFLLFLQAMFSIIVSTATWEELSESVLSEDNRQERFVLPLFAALYFVVAMAQSLLYERFIPGQIVQEQNQAVLPSGGI